MLKDALKRDCTLPQQTQTLNQRSIHKWWLAVLQIAFFIGIMLNQCRQTSSAILKLGVGVCRGGVQAP